MSSGGASAGSRGADLRGDAARARADRLAGGRVQRGRSETALKREARAWEAGAVGEQRSARQVERLGRYGFTVLHDVLLEPGKAWNLDHVVVGPAGVFFVDAKMWRGRAYLKRGALWRSWFGGPSKGAQSQDMSSEVRKIAGMAARASERLGVRVVPVLALAGSTRQFEGRVVVGGVTVVSVDGLVPWLRDASSSLTGEQVGYWAARAVRVFPPAVPEDPTDPKVVERERWAAAMRSGGPPSTRGAAGAPEVPATAPTGRRWGIAGVLARLDGRDQRG